MASAESVRGTTAVDVVPVVVGVRDDQVASVLVRVAVRVADQRCLPVVVDVRVRHGHVVTGVGDVDQAVVVVLVVVQVAGDVDVVDPDVVGGLDGDGVTVVGQNLGDLHVTDDNVGLPVDGEADTRKALSRWSASPPQLVFEPPSHAFSWRLTGSGLSDDGLVGGDLDLRGARQRSAQHDNCRAGRTHGSGKLRQGADRGRSAACASRGTAILFSLWLAGLKNRQG